MRGRRNKPYTTKSGAAVTREAFEWWICFAVWVYLLQSIPLRGADNWRRRVPAFERVAKLTAVLARRMDSRPLTALAVRKVWNRRDRYPSALAEAELYVLDRVGHLRGSKPTMEERRRVRAWALMTMDADEVSIWLEGKARRT